MQNIISLLYLYLQDKNKYDTLETYLSEWDKESVDFVQDLILNIDTEDIRTYLIAYCTDNNINKEDIKAYIDDYFSPNIHTYRNENGNICEFAGNRIDFDKFLKDNKEYKEYRTKKRIK